MTEKIDLSISKELKQKLEEKIKETNFESLEAYINFILEQITSETETEVQAYSEKEEAEITSPGAYSEEEETALKKNLEDLGYM